MSINLGDLKERLLRSVDSNNPTQCWVWLGKKTESGGARTNFGSSLQYVHRLSAMLFLNYDLRDKKHLVCHKHDCNPACINPTHLYIGDHSTNAKDQVAMGMHNMASKAICKNGHAFSPENTYYRTRPGGGRCCKICKLASKRRIKKRAGPQFRAYPVN